MHLKTNKVAFVIAFSLLVYSLLVASINVEVVKAADDTMIYIRADGSVEGTNKIHRDGNIYNFTDDVFGSIVVERDAVVIDGAGYRLQGNGIKTGIKVTNRMNVTIINVEIKNFSTGISFSDSVHCTISESTITANEKGIMFNIGSLSNNTIIGNNITDNAAYGVYFMFSYNNTLSGNRIANNGCGIYFEHSTNNLFRNNQFNENNENVHLVYNELSDGFNDVDSSNTVDGKPICYLVNQQNRAVPSDAGYVALVNCTNIIVQNLDITNSPHGIIVIATTDSTVANNNIKNSGKGIALVSAKNITIRGNSVTGISTLSSRNITIKENDITNSNVGVSLTGSQGVIVSRNNITSNSNGGVEIRYSNDNNISYNYIADNQYAGIILTGIGNYECSENRIIGNTLIENNGEAIYLSGAENNTCYHNNFIDNKVSDGIQVSNPWFWGYAEPNVWDNGNEGNYWSEYSTRYTNATEIDNSGIGDTPFVINEANTDNYPFMAPVDTDVIPEFPLWSILPTFLIATLLVTSYRKKMHKAPSEHI